MWGQVIAAGASLLGSIFGKKKQKTETTIDYVKMAQNAQAAGFNPLTALRNGGSAGFTSTISHPGLSGVGDAVAQLGGAIGNAVDQRIDPIEQKRDQVESALLDYQLSTIQAGPKAPMMFGDVPTKKGQPVAVQLAPPMSSRGGAPSSAVASSPNSGVRYLEPPKTTKEGTPLWVRGVDRDGKGMWIANPDGPDMEQYIGADYARARYGLERAADSLMNWRSKTTVRKLTEAEKKKRDESWLPSWMPRVNFSW